MHDRSSRQSLIAQDMSTPGENVFVVEVRDPRHLDSMETWSFETEDQGESATKPRAYEDKNECE